MTQNKIYLADNLDVLKDIPDNSIDLCYTDSPFNTGKTQTRTYIETTQDETGDRTGFGGKKYKTKDISSASYNDTFDDFIGFLEPRIKEIHRVLKPTGSFYFHMGHKEVHYCKVFIDSVFGRENYLNTLIWAWDYGAKSKKKWSSKHDHILFYVKDLDQYYFNSDSIERIPYKAPELCGPEKAARGKLPTDAWEDIKFNDSDYLFHTIVPTNGKEKMGYPTQKPLGIMRRMLQASCPPNGLVLDIFAGSGTTGAAAAEAGHNFILIDTNPEAFEVMKKRFSGQDVEFIEE